MKAPLTMETYAGHKKILEDAINFLVGLKDCQGNQMLKSPKKTGFLGWCLSSHSFLSLYDSLVGFSPGSPLRYLLGYRFSQDHLELIFVLCGPVGDLMKTPQLYSSNPHINSSF